VSIRNRVSAVGDAIDTASGFRISGTYPRPLGLVAIITLRVPPFFGPAVVGLPVVVFAGAVVVAEGVEEPHPIISIELIITDKTNKASFEELKNFLI
jgi:hypothetical protein